MDLTPRQKQVYELRNSTDPPMSYADIGRRIGIAMETARGTYSKAESKMAGAGNSALTDRQTIKQTEYTDPEKAVEVLLIGADASLRNLAEICRAEGLPPSATHSLIERMKADYPKVTHEVERIKTIDLIKLFEQKSKMALETINQDKLDVMSAYQLMIMGAIGAEKRQLLAGMPTERVSIEDRRALKDLVPMLLEEIQRRGFEREINPETGKGFIRRRQDAPLEVLVSGRRMEPIEVEPG